jgi:small conductance mechanosensitive channel
VTPLLEIVALLQAQPSPTPKPGATPSCPNATELCGLIYEKTGNKLVAEASYLVLVKPAQILFIVILAVVARFLINRMIDRLVRATTNDSSPTLLRPLRQKVPDALRNAAVLPERRRQRAEALGSVLRSITSAVVFVIAVMMILDQLGFQLAPLLTGAGIVGLAIGFGAQNLVKDFITGLFMLLEDQYGVGDVVDVGQASGTVESVGLRITTIRDAQGVVWYIRNGEILRVGNKSQGWAVVIVDMPVGFAGIEAAIEVLRAAAARLAEDPDWMADLIEEPQVLGVEQITADGATLRTTVKTTSEAQWRVGRELRWRLTEALDNAGSASRVGAGQVYLPSTGEEPPVPPATVPPTDGTAGGAPAVGGAPAAGNTQAAGNQAASGAAATASRAGEERAAGTAVAGAPASPEISRGITESSHSDAP